MLVAFTYLEFDVVVVDGRQCGDVVTRNVGTCIEFMIHTIIVMFDFRHHIIRKLAPRYVNQILTFNSMYLDDLVTNLNKQAIGSCYL
jgi:hypothetical protein